MFCLYIEISNAAYAAESEASMKKDAKTMKEVAERCTKFCPCDSCNCTNSSKEDAVSCSKCTHYTPEKVCDIDLYAEIVSNHNL